MNLPLAIAVVLAGLLIGLAGSVWLLSAKLHDARSERDAARAELTQAYRAIDALAAERAAADRRNNIVATSRESILSAPEEDDRPVAQVLRQALDAADEIGGLK